jgi:DNA recombination protein RmuC
VPLITAIVLAIACAAAGILLTSLWARAAAATSRAEQARNTERLAESEARFTGAKQVQQEIEARLLARDQELLMRDQTIGNLRVSEANALTDAKNHSLQIARLEDELTQARSLRENLTTEQQRLGGLLARAETALLKERESANERLDDLRKAREQLSDQFSKLANDILEKKSQQFTEQNKASLGHLLDPLKTQLTDFKGTVERVYVEEGEKRVALAEQVKQLAALNAQLSNDAIGLTNALKGSSKTQGNWGEMVLERILEAGGLRRGHEYQVQEAHKNEEGRTVFPDVILHLPEGRHLVIDAKVSLLDYNDHVNGPTDDHREAAGVRHVNSIRTHFKGLSEKDYRSLHTLNTVDFVIMFVPIEPAFMLGISRDPNLWTQAWEKNVLLVSPSTLLFVVRTVSHIWKQEQQRSQWQEIARQGGLLHDKFSDFVADLSKVGEQLRKTQDSYDSAFNKLKTGKGNLINRAQALRKLGVKAVKPLPLKLVEDAEESAGEDETEAPPLLLDLAASFDDPDATQ